MRFFHCDGGMPQKGWVWVFGCDESGQHNQGDARIAKHNFGAKYGGTDGRISQSYAISVRDKRRNLLPLERVKHSISLFLMHAQSRPHERFYVCQIACDVGGFGGELIAPLFAKCPENCFLPTAWKRILDLAPATVDA